MTQPAKINLAQWAKRYAELKCAGLDEPSYGGPIERHLADGDLRLRELHFDNSAAALRLWNFLLSEEDRLRAARASGKKLVGAMKDLGTVPVLAFCLPEVVAFYPDGAWWLPCVMRMSDGLLSVADSLGVDESFCPVRAMLGAFVTEAHFPIPDLLVCSVGATCDDFSAIAQRLNGLGFPIFWWEIPARRAPEVGEEAVELPGGFRAPAAQVAFVRGELQRVKQAVEQLADESLNDADILAGIAQANHVRRLLDELRELAFCSAVCPMPSLEMLIAEMLAIHFCSDRAECIAVLTELLAEVRRRVSAVAGVLPADAARVFVVNPVADLRLMNLLEDAGARVCGTEYLFCHALDEIPENLPPMEALARMALADPMAGPAADRAERICRDVVRYNAQAVLICRIPGASHCATEGSVIAAAVRDRLHLPVVEIEVPPLIDSLQSSLRTRVEALVETVRASKKKSHKRT